MNSNFTKLLTLGAVFLTLGGYSQRSQSPSIQELLNYPLDAKEDVTKRDMYAKHFVNTNGTYDAYICGGPIHYQDANGIFNDIDGTISPSSSDYAFENKSNLMQSYFSKDLNTGGVRVEIAGKSLEMGRSAQLLALSESGDLISVLEDASSTEINANVNRAVYANLFQFGTSEFIVDRGMIKNNLILTDLPSNIPASTYYLAFSEIISLPEGYSMLSGNATITEPTVVGGGLTILDQNGTISMKIPVPDVFEQNDLTTTIFADGIWQKSYKVEQINATDYKISTLVPMSWVLEQGRDFPIVVDPTIDLTGALGGWMNTSGINNADFYVFDAYSYSGNSYKAWTLWDVSSVPQFGGILNSEINMYLNGTGSTSITETITVNNVTTSYGNYSGYNAAIYQDLGDGTYTTFDCDIIGYYGYTDLGTTADADIQAALSSGDFQLGFWMNTNGQTWKRFTASASTLRITYEACEVEYGISNYNGFKVSCFDSEDGYIAAHMSGDTLYNYSWTGPSSFTSTADSISGLETGWYFLTVTGNASWCLVEDSVFLNQPNMVNVYIDDVQNAHCTDDEDGTATAYAGGGILNSYSYLWDNAETTATAVNLAAGTHTVTVTDANGCEATDDAAVDFDYNLPVVDLGPADTGYCEGGSIILNAGGGFQTYVWNNGNTGQLFQVSAFGTYSVTVTSFNGCEGSDEINVDSEYALPNPNLGPNISTPATSAILDPGFYKAYVWSTGALTQTITVSLAGTYKVTVTDFHDCKGNDEIKVEFWALGINEESENGLNLYPNPTTERVTLSSIGEYSGNVNVSILNAEGKVVATRTILSSSIVNEQFDVSNFPTGVYILQLNAGDEKWSKQFVKQ